MEQENLNWKWLSDQFRALQAEVRALHASAEEARGPQGQAPAPEERGPEGPAPSGPEEAGAPCASPEDREQEGDPCDRFWELACLLRQLQAEVEALRAEREPRSAQSSRDRCRRAAQARTVGRRSRILGFTAGVGLSLLLMPVLTFTFRFGIRLLRALSTWLDFPIYRLIPLTGIAVLGVLVLTSARSLGGWLMRKLEADEEDEDYEDGEDFEEDEL
jgi:hypothetical protein